MMASAKRIFLLFVLITEIYSGHACSQELSIDRTLDYLNRKFNGACKVDVKNGDLIAEFYDASGTCIRRDKGAIEYLDPKLTALVKEEKMIYLFCSEEDCVERKLMGNTKVTRRYDRYPFLWEGDEKSGQGIVNAFNHLIRLMNEPKYKSATPFE